MGGLYFWVCKMKPDVPLLGCELVLTLCAPRVLITLWFQLPQAGSIRSPWSLQAHLETSGSLSSLFSVAAKLKSAFSALRSTWLQWSRLVKAAL
jgi:hypothetical protein